MVIQFIFNIALSDEILDTPHPPTPLIPKGEGEREAKCQMKMLSNTNF